MHARLVPVVLALCLAAAGCSDDGGAAGPTLPPITQAPSPSASATVLAVPSEAAAPTPEGASEFGRYFVNEVYQAYVTLDPERVRRLSTPGCGTCQQYVESIQTIRENSASIATSYRVEVLDVFSPGIDAGATSTNVTVFLRIGEFVVTTPDGSELVREPAQEQAVQDLVLDRTGSSWQVSRVTLS